MIRSAMAEALPSDVEMLQALLLKERAEHAAALLAKDCADERLQVGLQIAELSNSAPRPARTI